MKKIITYGTYFILLSLILNSCYTVSTLDADVLNPAKKAYPSYIYNVGVISRMDLDVKGASEKTDKKAREVFERDSMLLKSAVYGLLDGLAESPRFAAFYIRPDRVLSGNSMSLNNELPWELVESLSKKDSLDLLISLVSANFKDTVLKSRNIRNENIKEFVGDNDAFLEAIRSDSYSDAYILMPILYWRFYDIRSREVSQFLQRDTIIYDSGSYYSGYPPRETVIKYFLESLGDSGYKYSHKLAPYWTSEARAWFPVGDASFNKAGKLARDGDWIAASEIWKKLAYSDIRKIAARASLNMAVASEMMDEIDIAIVWAERAKELGLDYYSKHYIDVLKKRQKNLPILDSQMK